MTRKRVSMLLAGGLIVLLAACSKEGGGGILVPSDTVTVTGTVSSKDDQTPVDGGVTLVLAVGIGARETLFFGSLYREPPPTPERLELYRVIVDVQVGSRVEAMGKRVEGGIDLQALTILSR